VAPVFAEGSAALALAKRDKRNKEERNP